MKQRKKHHPCTAPFLVAVPIVNGIHFCLGALSDHPVGGYITRAPSKVDMSQLDNPANEYPYFGGYVDEKGKGQAVGSNHNEPLPKDTQIEQYSAALDRIINKIQGFNPSFLIIAAGFDTHIDDPIGGFKIRTEDYISIGNQFKSLGIPTLVCQEGGYNVDVLGHCVKNFLLGLM